MNRLRVALVAHDEKKPDRVSWVEQHRHHFKGFELYATGTTGLRVTERCPELPVKRLTSGPLGGDQQMAP
jgi:methylglyoxal synthase